MGRKYCKCGGCCSKTDVYDEKKDDIVPAWRCNNCREVTNRRVPQRREGQTKSQREMLELLREEILRIQFGAARADQYEIKQWDVKDIAGRVMLHYVTGRKNDEGTAAVLCRNHGHVVIGRRGGIKSTQYLDGGQRKTVRGNWRLALLNYQH